MRCVVALNFSTDPISLWLLYDYTHPGCDFGCVSSLEAGLTNWDLYCDPRSIHDNGENDVSVNPSQFSRPGTSLTWGKFCEDVRTWDESQGFKGDAVKVSLARTHYLKGTSLCLKSPRCHPSASLDQMVVLVNINSA